MFPNGVKELDFPMDEEHIVIPKDFLSKVTIHQGSRGSFSDLQVYSHLMDEESLAKWTTCQYDQPGDVYEWDITRFNLTHDPTIVSAIEKVDTNLFCKSQSTGQKEFHVFGDYRIDTMSNFEGIVLCERLNAKILMLSASEKEMRDLDSYLLLSYAKKTNITSPETWYYPMAALVGGMANISNSIGKSQLNKRIMSAIYY